MGSKKPAKKPAKKPVARQPTKKPAKKSAAQEPLKPPREAQSALPYTIMPQFEPETDQEQQIKDAVESAVADQTNKMLVAFEKEKTNALADQALKMLTAFEKEKNDDIDAALTEAAKHAGGLGSEDITAAVRTAVAQAEGDFAQQIAGFSAELHAALNAPEDKDIVEHAREVREERDRLLAAPKVTVNDYSSEQTEAAQERVGVLVQEREAVAEALGLPKSVSDLETFAKAEAARWKGKNTEMQAKLKEATDIIAYGQKKIADLQSQLNLAAGNEALATSFRMMYAVDFAFDNLPDDHKVFVEAAAEVIEAEARAAQRTTASA